MISNDYILGPFLALFENTNGVEVELLTTYDDPSPATARGVHVPPGFADFFFRQEMEYADLKGVVLVETSLLNIQYVRLGSVTLSVLRAVQLNSNFYIYALVESGIKGSV